MKRYIYAMSNVRGEHVKVTKGLPFSFFYSPSWTQHGPRVKVVFDPFKMREDNVGVQKLCDDWSFRRNKNDRRVSKQEIADMQEFFRKYLILFLLVWDRKSDSPDPADYFTGRISFKQLVQNIYFYEDYKEEMDATRTVAQLEEFCRKHNLVNMYEN